MKTGKFFLVIIYAGLAWLAYRLYCFVKEILQQNDALASANKAMSHSKNSTKATDTKAKLKVAAAGAKATYETMAKYNPTLGGLSVISEGFKKFFGF
jgi:hypothetical protein